MDYNELPYPLTIIYDRYNGVYSKGKFTAWNIYNYRVPADVDSDDETCYQFWRDNKLPVGVGDTPDAAIQSLITALK